MSSFKKVYVRNLNCGGHEKASGDISKFSACEQIECFHSCDDWLGVE